MILNSEVRSLKRVRIVTDRVLGQKVSTNTVERICLDVGDDLAAAEQREWNGVIDGEVPVPSLAIVEFDGGRIRTRKTDCGPGVHLEATGWNETKNAIFVSAASTPSDVDPQWEPLACFLDPDHVTKIAESGKTAENTDSNDSSADLAADDGGAEEPSSHLLIAAAGRLMVGVLERVAARLKYREMLHVRTQHRSADAFGVCCVTVGVAREKHLGATEQPVHQTLRCVVE